MSFKYLTNILRVLWVAYGKLTWCIRQKDEQPSIYRPSDRILIDHGFSCLILNSGNLKNSMAILKILAIGSYEPWDFLSQNYNNKNLIIL